MTTSPDLEKAVEFVSRRDWVTLVELQKFASVDLDMSTEGGYVYEVVPNGVVWAGMSQQFCELVAALYTDDRVAFVGGDVLSYLFDGGSLSLPAAKRAPRDFERGYSEPRWIVTALRPAEAGGL